MTIVHDHLHGDYADCVKVAIPADRWTLAKLRWRATATDGKQFGFDLANPLHHGDIVFDSGNSIYFIEQSMEDVLVVHSHASTEDLQLAWMIGNLHQAIEISGHEIIVADDPAVRQLFHARSVQFQAQKRIFQPLRQAHSHHHH